MLATQSANFVPRQPQIVHKQVTIQRPSSVPPPILAVSSNASPSKPTLPPPLAQTQQPTPPPSVVSPAASTSKLENLSLCKHIAKVVASSEDQESPFKLGVRWSLRLTSSNNSHAHSKKRRKIERPVCKTCSIALARPFLCLDCGSSWCGAREGADHALQHARSQNHPLHLDLHSRSVYCFSCGDYAYHPALERMINSEIVSYEDSLLAPAASSSGRKRVPFQPWKPSSSLTTTVEPLYPRGLRNLGQTCYMSVILQAFLHNPLLRSYFLSDKHNLHLCERSAEGDKPCLSCEMDRLFTESFSNEPTPFGPTSILYSVWLSSSELSGYAQQDAHEFLISAMNLIHATTPGSKNIDCSCIVHETFSGQLRSEVRCGKCGNVTASVDPFLDLSLDLKGQVAAMEHTLLGCLNRFTSSEKLSPGQYSCAKCGDNSQVASKRLGIKQLPPVLNIQFKRFEHSTNSHKIDTPVRFPLKLNMGPYITSSSSTDQSLSGTETPPTFFEYELSSVVCHEGQLTNGHFTCYCRGTDDFFCLDDDKVRRASLAEVLGSKAYLLTYVKKTLSFAERST
ncbi:cysteine proteinase [Meredithblackwellia eburnea MCA 4105]